MMKPPRAELTPHQLAASHPTELQELARKQNFEYGNLVRDRNLLQSNRRMLNDKLHHYNQYMQGNDLEWFQSTLYSYDELIRHMDELVLRIRPLQEAERVNVSKRNKQNWDANHVKRDN